MSAAPSEEPLFVGSATETPDHLEDTLAEFFAVRPGASREPIRRLIRALDEETFARLLALHERASLRGMR